MKLPELIENINTLQQEYVSYLPLPAERQDKLNKKFRLEFNYNSNHIEGNTLTYGETELYLIFDKTTGNHEGREYEEMKASDVALQMIQEYAQDKERPLTESFIKSLHELILVRPYWVDAITPGGQPTRRQIAIGVYKSQSNSVRLQNGEMFHYASPEETPALMGDLVQWYREEAEKGELHPVALAALLHYKFVRIHPFDDGNGRMSRLLMNYVLYANGLAPVIVKSADKKNYLTALNKADVGEINAFVAYIAEQLQWSLGIAIKAAKGESIEEQDDIDKEIEVWKKAHQNNKQKQVITKSNRVLQSLYFEQIQPLFALFEQKMEQFRDLVAVWETKTTIIVNGNRRIDIGYSDFPASFFTVDNYKGSDVPHATKNHIDIIEFSIRMDGIRENLKYPFTLLTDISVLFNQYNYEIKVSPQFVQQSFTNTYDEILTKENQIMLVNNIVKSIFEHIKSKTELNK